MGKKARAATARAAVSPRPEGQVAQVAPREPCPCGSGRRYKACHGRAQREAYVARPFGGLTGECDWVAMREIVPAATAALTLAGEHAGTSATLATVLPLAWPGLRREDGEVMVGLQVAGSSTDPNRDVAAALLSAIEAEPGSPVAPGGLPGPGPRLEDVLDATAPLNVTVHSGFEFWLDGLEDGSGSSDVAASMERANEAAVPTERLSMVEAAYWCRIGDRSHLRWVLPYDEGPLLDAMARLKATGREGLGEGTRFVGSFRAHGLLVPVWDLAEGTTAEDVEDPAHDYAERLGEALAETAPLDEDARRARSGLLSRQVTLR